MAVRTIASNGGTAVGNTTVYATSQNFTTPDATYNLTKIAIPLANSDPQAATTTAVKIYSVDVNNKPDALLASMGTIASTSLSTTFVNKEFSGGTCVLDPLTEYAIVISVTGDAGCSVRWQGSSTGTGLNLAKATSGSEWAEDGTPRVHVVYGTYHNPPPKATAPDPADDAVDVSAALDIVLWETSGQEDSVDVYFGYAGSAELIESAWTEGNYYAIALPLEAGQEYEWRIDTTNEAGTTAGDVWSFTVALSLTLTPTAPTNAAVGVAVVTPEFTWACDGFDPETMVFNVYLREADDSEFVLIAENTSDLSTILPGNLVYNTDHVWRVDVLDVEVPGVPLLVGDEWTFDTDVSLVLTPTFPTHEADGVLIAPAEGVIWDCQPAVPDTQGYDPATMAFDVYFSSTGGFVGGESPLSSGQPDLTLPLPFNLSYGWQYYWKIVVRELSTGAVLLEGSAWSFDTQPLIEYPIPRYRTVLAPGQPPGGTTMSVATAENCLASIKRLVAASQNTIWYEYEAGV